MIRSVKMKLRFKNWRKYGFEFLSIFVAVVSAFALNNWNDNRRDANSEHKILMEISNGLEKDLQDIALNVMGHESGIDACQYFRKVFAGNVVPKDSLMQHFHNLTRDFISVQNIAGYETLKSKGLELVKNNALRHKIISLYEYDYNNLRKFEEEYYEMQFQKNYFKEINAALAPNFKINDEGMIFGVNMPMEIPENDKNLLLLYLWKIQTNRVFILKYYTDIKGKINLVREKIDEELAG